MRWTSNNSFQATTLYAHASTTTVSTVEKPKSISDPLGSSNIQKECALKEMSGKSFGEAFSSATVNLMSDVFQFGHFSDFPAADATVHFARCIIGSSRDKLS